MNDEERERELHMLTQARMTLRNALKAWFRTQEQLKTLADVEARLAELEAVPSAPDAPVPTATAKKKEKAK